MMRCYQARPGTCSDADCDWWDGRPKLVDLVESDYLRSRLLKQWDAFG